MKTARPFLTQLLRLDWAIYLLIVGVLLCAFGAELANANSASSRVTLPAEPMALPLAGISLGAIYSLIVLVVIPVTALVVVNLRASRRFRASLNVQPTVPIVDAKAPVVRAKRATETSKPA